VDKEKKIQNVKELSEQLLSYVSAYHNHKETMAHTALVMQTAIFAYVMTADKQELSKFSKPTIAGAALVWLGIHLYIRWQLRNRRWAAAQVGGLRAAMGKWTIEDPQDNDLTSYLPTDTVNTKSLCGMLKKVADFLFPYRGGGIPVDKHSEGFPAGIVELMKKNKSGGIISEWLIFAGSVLMLLMILLRMFLSIIASMGECP